MRAGPRSILSAQLPERTAEFKLVQSQGSRSGRECRAILARQRSRRISAERRQLLRTRPAGSGQSQAAGIPHRSGRSRRGRIRPLLRKIPKNPFSDQNYSRKRWNLAICGHVLYSGKHRCSSVSLRCECPFRDRFGKRIEANVASFGTHPNGDIYNG